MTVEDFNTQLAARLSGKGCAWTAVRWHTGEVFVIPRMMRYDPVGLFPKTVEGVVEAAAFIEAAQIIHEVLAL